MCSVAFQPSILLTRVFAVQQEARHRPEYPGGKAPPVDDTAQRPLRARTGTPSNSLNHLAGAAISGQCLAMVLHVDALVMGPQQGESLCSWNAEVHVRSPVNLPMAFMEHSRPVCGADAAADAGYDTCGAHHGAAGKAPAGRPGALCGQRGPRRRCHRVDGHQCAIRCSAAPCAASQSQLGASARCCVDSKLQRRLPG